MAQDLSNSDNETLRELATGEFNTDEQFDEMLKRNREKVFDELRPENPPTEES